MKIIQAILAFIVFTLFLELLGVWVFLDQVVELTDFIIRYYALINSFLEFVLVGLFMYKVHGKAGIEVQDSPQRYYMMAIAIGLGYMFIQTPLNIIYNYFFDTKYQIFYHFSFRNVFSTNALALIVFFPIAEELFFRHHIQKRLQEHHKPAVAILVTAVLFGLLHIQYLALFWPDVSLDVHHAYITFFGGILLGILYYKSQSIGPPILMHITWNLMYVII